MDKKRVKRIVKEVRLHYTKKYNTVISYLFSSEEEFEERLKDVKLLLAYEKHYYDEIEAIKLQLELENQEEQFRAKVDNEVTAQEYMLTYLDEQTTLIEEELQRISSKKETKSSEIKKKQRKIDKLNSRLNNLAKCKAKVQELIKELAPQKRKVGRPKKIKIEEKTETA